MMVDGCENEYDEPSRGDVHAVRLPIVVVVIVPILTLQYILCSNYRAPDRSVCSPFFFSENSQVLGVPQKTRRSDGSY